MKLADRVAVITGGGTGIGQDAALTLAREGARVVVSGRRIEPLQETVKLVEEIGGEALAVSCDVTVDSDIERLRDETMNKWGRVDILINNAGAAMMQKFNDTSLEDFDKVYRVDLRSVFAVSKAFVPIMQEQGKGVIVNVSSILGVFGGLRMSAYCAAKGGVNNLTRAMAAELGPAIRVNAVCPSHIETPMMSGSFEYLKSQNKWEKLLKVFPLKRVGYPVDTSNAILFLASDDSSWITGNIMVLDGGMSCFV
ncbi:MAG: SDR family NAD(P)-dependent oxidoreductase [Chitinophagales bacterium]